MQQYLSRERQNNILSLFRVYKNVELTQEMLVADVKDTSDAARSIARTTRRLVDAALTVWDLVGVQR